MPRLRPGRDQLNIINVSDDVIKEFEAERKGRGPGGKDIPRWELFEKAWKEWKTLKSQKVQGNELEELKHLREYNEVLEIRYQSLIETFASRVKASKSKSKITLDLHNIPAEVLALLKAG